MMSTIWSLIESWEKYPKFPKYSKFTIFAKLPRFPLVEVLWRSTVNFTGENIDKFIQRFKCIVRFLHSNKKQKSRILQNFSKYQENIQKSRPNFLNHDKIMKINKINFGGHPALVIVVNRYLEKSCFPYCGNIYFVPVFQECQGNVGVLKLWYYKILLSA